MDIRLASVRKHLLSSDVTLKEIARNTGFYDEYYLSKMFKNKFGQSPYAFRANTTSAMREYSIGNLIPFPYNELDQVSFGKLKGEGAKNMFKQMRNKAVIAAVRYLWKYFPNIAAIISL